jgi:hypothetical protein
MRKAKEFDLRIPTHVRVTSRVTYQVLWTEGFKDKLQLAECDTTTKQIIIRSGMSKQQTALAYLHELFHAMDAENKIKLTETQVEKLEQAFATVRRLNK